MTDPTCGVRFLTFRDARRYTYRALATVLAREVSEGFGGDLIHAEDKKIVAAVAKNIRAELLRKAKEWWAVSSGDVIHYVAIYRIDTPWAEVFPDDDDEHPGAPFKDDWQIIRNGSFVGRNVGWTLDWLLKNVHETEAEARARAHEFWKETVETLRIRLERSERRLDAAAAWKPQ